MSKITAYSDKKSINTLDRGSYGDFGDGTPAKQVNTGDFYLGHHYDKIDVTYPTTTTEVFTYTLLAVTKRIITMTYTNSSKSDLVSVVVT